MRARDVARDLHATDKISSRASPSNHPGILIHRALTRFECSIHRMIDAGDHTILIAEVLDAEHTNGRPLVYFGSGYRKLGGETGGM